MPKPPILPVLDWRAVFDSGRPYADWLDTSENTDNAGRIEAIRSALPLESQVVGFLGALPRPVHVVAIAEAWCGDVVRHVPVLERLAECAPRLEVRFISREQHPDVFVRFLTNGGEAIPKFIFLSDQFTECGHWGPMPNAYREIIARGKACGDVAAARKKVGALYAADANYRDVIAELVHLIDVASTATP